MSVPELDQSRVIEISERFPDPHKLQNAVVFIRANWSGYSKASLNNLMTASRMLDDSWKIIILDTDNIQFQDFQKVYGPFPSSGGWGEAFWVRAGVLIHSDRGYYNGPLRKLLWNPVREFSTLDDLQVPEFLEENEFKLSVIKNCGDFPVDQLAINDLDCVEISELHLAAVVLYHVNRAQAVVALRALVKELKNVANSTLKLIVLNADAVAFADMIRTFGEAPEAGKTYWVMNGQVISKAQWLSAANERRS